MTSISLGSSLLPRAMNPVSKVSFSKSLGSMTRPMRMRGIKQNMTVRTRGCMVASYQKRSVFTNPDISKATRLPYVMDHGYTSIVNMLK